MIAELVGTCALGLGLGLRHALESDHVAAIGTMVADGHGPKRAALLGASWGAGHGLAVLGAGLALVALRVTVPAPIAAGLDVAVALMLALLGVGALAKGRAVNADGHARGVARSPRSPRAAMAIGLVHGASGTAALTLLVLTTLPDRVTGAAFLAVFTLGATLAMTALSALLALPLGAAMARWRPAARTVQLAAGAVSLAAAAMVALSVVSGVVSGDRAH